MSRLLMPRLAVVAALTLSVTGVGLGLATNAVGASAPVVHCHVKPHAKADLAGCNLSGKDFNGANWP